MVDKTLMEVHFVDFNGPLTVVRWPQTKSRLGGILTDLVTVY
jgi:hypothetical protein